MSKYKSPLLNLLQKKSRIYLDGINEEELEEKQFYSRRKFLDTSLKSSLALGLATSDFPANITTDTYHPSNEIDAGPDGMPGGAALSLANFTGNYNGTWNLFITDDNPNNGGSLTSWAIVFNVPTAASEAVSYQWASNNGTTLNNNTTATPTSAPSATC